MKLAHSHGQETRPDCPPDLARRAAVGDFSPEVLVWLAEGLRRHVVEGKPLTAALWLDRASRFRARDDALRRAAALLTLGSEGPCVVADRLALAVVRQARLQSTPATPLEVALAQAFAADLGVPETSRQLYDIIR